MHSVFSSIFLVLFFPFFLLPQVFVFEKTIGSFQRATAFSYIPSGYFFVMDVGDYSLKKIDTLGIESVRSGGFGWDDGLFDEPVDVFATTLSVYVTDYTNHRIQQFDAQLNFISKLVGSTDGNSGIFQYPVACTVSPSGDFFVLESYGKKIVKFSFSGDFLSEFGGIESGEFSLSDPKAMTIDAINGTILVLENNSITYFDTFGNGMKKIRFDSKGFRDFCLFNEIIIISDGHNLTLFLPKSNTTVSARYVGETPEIIKDLTVYENRLYILGEKAIYVYQILWGNESQK